MEGDVRLICSPSGLQHHQWKRAVLQCSVYLCADDTSMPTFLARDKKILELSELLCISLVSDYVICTESR